ncbi:MAG: hypothetical protein ABI950_11090 [Solirubrobacteraceae bacterium]
MASTKKKRQTKHRGNAAGFVETRGRTGRNRPDVAPAKGKRAKSGGGTMAQARANRFAKPPTWIGAFQRALFAIVIFIGVVVLAFGQKPLPAIALGVFMLLLYTPMGYLMDSYFYKRRRKQAVEAKVEPRKAKT